MRRSLRSAPQGCLFGGGPLAEQGVVRAQIAESRLEIEQARLLCHRACHVIDTEGNKAARNLVAMAKVAVPRAATAVMDRAIQVHGGAGVTRTDHLVMTIVSSLTLRITRI